MFPCFAGSKRISGRLALIAAAWLAPVSFAPAAGAPASGGQPRQNQGVSAVFPPVFPAPGKPLDLGQVAQSPACWPREIFLLNPVSIPVESAGRFAGQTLLPAGTPLRLVRVLALQVEVECQGARQMIAADATDLLSRASRLRSETLAAQAAAINHLARAREVTEAIQRDFWDPQTGRYSEKPGDEGPGSAWSCGVMFSALAGAVRHDPVRYQAVLKKSFLAFDAYWDGKQPLGGYEPFPANGDGHDKYYDDNEWLVLAFLEASEVTGQPEYAKRAAETTKFVLSGWDETYLRGGIWWHEARERKARQKNTCANAPAAVACLRLARVSPPAEARGLTVMARRITDWTVANLELPNRLFGDTRDIEGGGMNRVSLTYNPALMLRAFLGLYRVTGDVSFLRRAQRIGLSAGLLIDQKTGVYHDHPKWAHLMVEADLALYRATGEPYLLQRARRQANAYYDQWKAKGPEDLIMAASVARTLWLLADTETAVGRAFWQKADAPVRFP